jgi:hypothetical protein
MVLEAFLQRVGSMVSGKLAQFLKSIRSQPYLLGVLASLPIALMMLQVWKYNAELAVLSLFLPPFMSLDVFKKTPTRKMVSLAVVCGTMLPLFFL